MCIHRHTHVRCSQENHPYQIVELLSNPKHKKVLRVMSMLNTILVEAINYYMPLLNCQLPVTSFFANLSYH